MPRRGNEDRVLQNVDKTKKEKFNEKYQKLASRDWTRDTYKKNMEETEQAIENIEDFITGLQDDLEDYRRQKNGNRFDEIKEDFGGEDEVERLEEQEIHPRDYPTLGRLREAERERGDILRRILEWKTLQDELAEMAAEKMTRVAETLNEKFRSGQARRDFENYVQDKLDDRMDKVKAEIRQDFQEDIADLEQVTQAARSEIKFARSFLQKFGKASVEELQHISDKTESLEDVDVENLGLVQVPEDAPDLADFQKEDGTMDLSARQLRKARTEEAVEKSQEEDLPGADTPDGDGDTDEDLYELKGKSLSEQKEVIDRMSQELDIDEMTQREVASKTDSTKTYLYGPNKILDKIEEEYGTRHGF